MRQEKKIVKNSSCSIFKLDLTRLREKINCVLCGKKKSNDFYYQIEKRERKRKTIFCHLIKILDKFSF